jgi:hypothetical protein
LIFATTGSNNFNGSQVITGSVYTTKPITSAVFTLTDVATITSNATSASTFHVSSSANRTIGTCSSGVDGQRIVWRLHNTGSSAITFSLTTGSANGFRFGSNITTLTPTTASKSDYLGTIFNLSASRWDCVAYIKGY